MCHNLQLARGVAQAVGDTLSEGQCLWQLGACLVEIGAWRDAEAPLVLALESVEKARGPLHLDISRVCNSLAIVYYKVCNAVLLEICHAFHVYIDISLGRELTLQLCCYLPPVKVDECLANMILCGDTHS